MCFKLCARFFWGGRGWFLGQFWWREWNTRVFLPLQPFKLDSVIAFTTYTPSIWRTFNVLRSNEMIRTNSYQEVSFTIARSYPENKNSIFLEQFASYVHESFISSACSMIERRFVWSREKKRHDPLIWRKEKREKGQKRETSGSNQEAVSLKRRRIVKEIRSTEQKKRTKKRLWIG